VQCVADPFYSTILAAPILIVMALSGLVIMYAEPITGFAVLQDHASHASHRRWPPFLEPASSAGCGGPGSAEGGNAVPGRHPEGTRPGQRVLLPWTAA